VYAFSRIDAIPDHYLKCVKSTVKFGGLATIWGSAKVARNIALTRNATTIILSRNQEIKQD